MKLYVIRHAQAADYSAATGDSGRSLTAKGEKQAAAIGSHFMSCKVAPEIVLTSPVVRAHQTATILSDRAGLERPMTANWLRCGMRPEVAVAELVAYKDFEHVAIVGHNPDIYWLLHHLLVDAPPRVKKASVHVLEDFQPPSRSAVLEASLQF